MITNNKIIGMLIAVAFILITGIVTRYTAAVDVSSAVNITEAEPAIDSIRFATIPYGADTLTATGILPSVGTSTTIHINGVMRDNNGEIDIASSSVSLVFYKTSATNACAEDNNDCYVVVDGCTLDYTYGNVAEVAYNCPVDIAYWIDATDATSIYSADNWTAEVSVHDLGGLTDVREANIEVRSLLALTLPPVVDYGDRMLDEKSTVENNIHTSIVQAGNTKADIELMGGQMICDVFGTLATSSQAWALTDVDYQNSTQLTDVFVRANRNIDLRTDETIELSGILYWNISIPVIGVKGVCTGNNTITIYAQGT